MWFFVILNTSNGLSRLIYKLQVIQTKPTTATYTLYRELFYKTI